MARAPSSQGEIPGNKSSRGGSEWNKGCVYLWGRWDPHPLGGCSTQWRQCLRPLAPCLAHSAKIKPFKQKASPPRVVWTNGMCPGAPAVGSMGAMSLLTPHGGLLAGEALRVEGDPTSLLPRLEGIPSPFWRPQPQRDESGNGSTKPRSRSCPFHRLPP